MVSLPSGPDSDPTPLTLDLARVAFRASDVDRAPRRGSRLQLLEAVIARAAQELVDGHGAQCTTPLARWDAKTTVGRPRLASTPGESAGHGTCVIMRSVMTPGLCRYTVLVVDDDPSVLATYQRLLRRAGYNTVTRDDPSRVLHESAGDGVDLLVIDYKMPGMDGLSLLAELRRRRCRARCVLISAFLNDDVRGQARDLGVDRVLEKPVDISMLREVILDLLPREGAHGTPAS